MPGVILPNQYDEWLDATIEDVLEIQSYAFLNGHLKSCQ
jgi:hypothetical protein